jgi:hypothetical protein
MKLVAHSTNCTVHVDVQESARKYSPLLVGDVVHVDLEEPTNLTYLGTILNYLTDLKLCKPVKTDLPTRMGPLFDAMPNTLEELTKCWKTGKAISSPAVVEAVCAKIAYVMLDLYPFPPMNKPEPCSPSGISFSLRNLYRPRWPPVESLGVVDDADLFPHIMCSAAEVDRSRVSPVEVLCSSPERFQWGVDNGFAPRLLCCFAAYGGHFDVLRWARLHDYFVRDYLCDFAAAGGQFQMLQWLISEGCEDQPVCGYAAAGGHLDIMTWSMDRHHATGGFEGVFKYAAMGGHIHILKYLRERGYEWDERTPAYAAFGGQLPTMKWLAAQDPPCPSGSKTSQYAMQGGHVHVLNWLCDTGKFTARDLYFRYALRTGKLDTVKWMYKRFDIDIQNDAQVCDAVPHIELLQWMRSHNPPCPWDEETCRLAVLEDNLQVLEWARANGCPWDKTQCLKDASPGVREWILKH